MLLGRPGDQRVGDLLTRFNQTKQRLSIMHPTTGRIFSVERNLPSRSLRAHFSTAKYAASVMLLLPSARQINPSSHPDPHQRREQTYRSAPPVGFRKQHDDH